MAPIEQPQVVIPSLLQNRIIDAVRVSESHRNNWKEIAKELMKVFGTKQIMQRNEGVILDCITQGFTDDEIDLMHMKLPLKLANVRESTKGAHLRQLQIKLKKRRNAYFSYLLGHVRGYLTLLCLTCLNCS